MQMFTEEKEFEGFQEASFIHPCFSCILFYSIACSYSN